MLLIDVNNVYKSIGPIDLLESIAFKLYKDNKINIVGINGIGNYKYYHSKRKPPKKMTNLKNMQ